MKLYLKHFSCLEKTGGEKVNSEVTDVKRFCQGKKWIKLKQTQKTQKK